MTINRANMSSRMNMIAHWPPLLYFALGVVGLIFWAGGTSIQVLTSEAWIQGHAVGHISFAPFQQIGDFVSGKLPDSLLVPFCFAWGVQIASIIASIGIELPRYPAWRYYVSWSLVILLIGVNSCGDYQFSSEYGMWGQIGFTVVVLFLTFFVGLLSIMAFMHGVKVLRAAE